MKSLLFVLVIVPAFTIPIHCAELHKPHAFDFSYSDEIVVIEGTVRGAWYGNTHSAIFIEPVAEEESEMVSNVDPEVERLDRGESDGVPVPEEPSDVIVPAGVSERGTSGQTGMYPSEVSPEETLLLWEIETYPGLTLEMADWSNDALADGDTVVAALKPSTSSEMRGQLLGITRLVDGWTGLGYPFPEGLDMETVLADMKTGDETEMATDSAPFETMEVTPGSRPSTSYPD